MKLNKYMEDTDRDSIPDDKEVLLQEYWNYNRTKSAIIGKIISRPDLLDGDSDGIPDVDDPSNSYIEQEIAWENDGHTYGEAFIERAKTNVNDKDEIKKYINKIELKAKLLYQMGSILGTGFWEVDSKESDDSVLVFKDTDGFGDALLGHYLNADGRAVQFNAGDFLQTLDGKNIYQKCVEYAMEICENGVAKDCELIFKQKDGAIKSGVTYLTEQYFTFDIVSDYAHPLASLQQWLSLNQTFSAISGKCVYDGEYYNLELTYFLQDYYDWYYPEVVNGKNGIIVTCDEMCWLHLYDKAKNFSVLGVYRENIRWKKGEDFSGAEHTRCSFSPFKK